MCAERVTTSEAELLRLLLFAVDRTEKRATFEGEDGLRVFGVAELSSAMRVIPCMG